MNPPVQAYTPNISPYIKALSEPKEIDKTNFYHRATVATVLQGVKNYLDYTSELKQQADYNEAHAAFSANVSIAAKERMRQKVDAQGKPAYPTLATDIDKVAQDLGANYLKGLAGRYAEKFKNDILSIRGQLAVKAYSETRKQQDEYIQSALDTSLTEIMDAAVADESINVEKHVADYAQTIAEAISTGYLSKAEGKKFIEKAREEMLYNNFMKEAVINPEAIQPMILESSARELGITQQHYNNLISYTNRRIQTNQIELNKRQNQNASDIHLSIATTNQLENLISEEDIRQAEQQGEISSLQANDLVLQRFNRQKKIEDAMMKMLLSRSPNELENPLLSEENKKILYNADLERRIAVAKQAKGGEKLTDEELFQLNVDTTLAMPFACKEMANLLHQAVKNATNENYATAVLSAYAQLKGKSTNNTLSLVGAAHSAVLSMATLLLSGNSDMSAINALNMARQTVSETAADPLRQAYNKQKLSTSNVRDNLYGTGLTKTNIETAIADFLKEAFNLDRHVYNPFTWFRGSVQINNSDILEVKQILDNMFVLLGDEKTAREAAKDIVKASWGVQVLAGNKVLMSYPPTYQIRNVLVPFKETRMGQEFREANATILALKDYEKGGDLIDVLKRAKLKKVYIGGIPRFYYSMESKEKPFKEMAEKIEAQLETPVRKALLADEKIPLRYTRKGYKAEDVEAMARLIDTPLGDILSTTQPTYKYDMLTTLRKMDEALDQKVFIDIDFDFERFIYTQMEMMTEEDRKAVFALQADPLTKVMAPDPNAPITYQVTIKRKGSDRFVPYVDKNGNTLRYPRYKKVD